MEKLLDGVVSVMKSLEDRILARLESLERRAAVPGEPGQKGDPGEAGPMGPAGPAGAPGEVGPQGPPGLDGKDGAPGPPGADGLHGKDGAAGPVGERGPEGIAGRDGLPGRDGQPGLDGKDGARGLDGKDGADGLGFDDFEESIEDGGRFIVRTWIRGDRVKAFRHQTATMIYRGVFVEGKQYEHGDVVTWGGSTWHGNEMTTTKPGDGSKAWTLMVKKGRDGRDGKSYEPTPQMTTSGRRV